MDGTLMTMTTIDLAIMVGLLAPFLVVGVGVVLGLTLVVANIVSGFFLGIFGLMFGTQSDDE